MNNTRTWGMRDEKEIEKLYKEAGSVDWYQNTINHLLSCIRELEEGIRKHRITKYPIQINTGIVIPIKINDTDKELYKLVNS